MAKDVHILHVDEVIVRLEKALDWIQLYKPPALERRLQDIEAEIARLRRWTKETKSD